MYELTPYCTLEALAGSSETIPRTEGWTWAEFETFCAGLPEGVVPIRGVTREDMLGLCARYAQRDFMDAKAGQCWFGGGAFARLLEFAASFPAEADLLIPLEIVDWTLTSYVRDACQLGMPKAILEMGHFNTEELGMKYLAKLLPEVTGADVPVKFIKSGDTYSYIMRG